MPACTLNWRACCQRTPSLPVPLLAPRQASRRAPAIIFLDELDALVPARAARAGGSDQIYASGRREKGGGDLGKDR